MNSYKYVLSPFEKREKFAWNVYMGWEISFISKDVASATLNHWKYIIMNNDELKWASLKFDAVWEPIG